MAEKVKISELSTPTQIKGDAVVPILQDSTNYKATMDALKAFFSDSTVVFFDAVDDAKGVNPNLQGKPTPESGAVIEIVYLSNYNDFLARKTLKGNKTYFVDFDGIENYKANGKIRQDKIFFSISDECMYKSDSNGVLKDPYAPIVLTQEEYDALAVKDENKTYYIVEE